MRFAGTYIASLIAYLTPLGVAVWLIAPYDTGPLEKTNNLGILKISPGQTILLTQTAAEEPENKTLVAVESFNRKITERAIENPALAAQLQETPGDRLKDLLLENPNEGDPEGIAATLEKAQGNGMKWHPQVGPWGLGATQNEQKPAPVKIPWGIASLPHGQERTRVETEAALNLTVFELRKRRVLNAKTLSASENPLMTLLQIATKEGDITPDRIPEITAAATILQIRYIEDKNLFLSKQTEPIIEKWSNQSE